MAWRVSKWPTRPHKVSPDSKVHGANMGPTWVLSAPDGPHVGLMNIAIRVTKLPSVRYKYRRHPIQQLGYPYNAYVMAYILNSDLITVFELKQFNPRPDEYVLGKMYLHLNFLLILNYDLVLVEEHLRQESHEISCLFYTRPGTRQSSYQNTMWDEVSIEQNGCHLANSILRCIFFK